MPSVQKTTLRITPRGSTARAAIRSHRRNIESRLIRSNNHIAFSYVYNKINDVNSQICLTNKNKSMSDKEAAKIFLHEFSGSFSTASNVNVCIDTRQLNGSSFQPYCTERMVDEALRKCSASNSSPDGISYKVLKAVAQHLLTPLNIIFNSHYTLIYSLPRGNMLS